MSWSYTPWNLPTQPRSSLDFFLQGHLPNFLLELTCVTVLGWVSCSLELMSSLLFTSSVSWGNLQGLPNKKCVGGKHSESSQA